MAEIISHADKNRLRELAKRQLEIAKSPRMEALRKRHWELNTKIRGTMPTVRIETDGLVLDMAPDKMMECTGRFARQLERKILHNLRHDELTGDDRIMPDDWQVFWNVKVDMFGFPVKRTSAYTSDGRHSGGYSTEHAIHDIPRDFHKLKPLTASVDRKGTDDHCAAIDGIFGDILPVELIGWPRQAPFLTRCLVDLMSLENFYIAALDEPDEVCRLMEYLLQNAFLLMEFYEREGIMYVNNGDTDLGNSTYPFTDVLPAPGYKGVPRLCDMFLRTDSQETVSISPAMFDELIFPYYKRLCEKAGLWYYGCCEPVNGFWEKSISKIKNIKKVSISKWCNEEIMGPLLLGSGIVYSRKIDALFFAVYHDLDEAGLEKYIRSTMKHARGCQIEFISREVESVCGNLPKLKTAVDIMRRTAADCLGAGLG